jgi:hypothetical protein
MKAIHRRRALRIKAFKTRLDRRYSVDLQKHIRLLAKKSGYFASKLANFRRGGSISISGARLTGAHLGVEYTFCWTVSTRDGRVPPHCSL